MGSLIVLVILVSSNFMMHTNCARIDKLVVREKIDRVGNLQSGGAGDFGIKMEADIMNSFHSPMFREELIKAAKHKNKNYPMPKYESPYRNAYRKGIVHPAAYQSRAWI